MRLEKLWSLGLFCLTFLLVFSVHGFAGSVPDPDTLFEQNSEIIKLQEQIHLVDLEIEQYIRNNGILSSITFSLNPYYTFDFSGTSSQPYGSINPTIEFDLIPAWGVYFSYAFFYGWETSLLTKVERTYSQFSLGFNPKYLIYNDYQYNLKILDIEKRGLECDLASKKKELEISYYSLLYEMMQLVYDIYDFKSQYFSNLVSMKSVEVESGKQSYDYKIYLNSNDIILENYASKRKELDVVFEKLMIVTGGKIGNLEEYEKIKEIVTGIFKVSVISVDDNKVLEFFKNIIQEYYSKNVKKKYVTTSFEVFSKLMKDNPGLKQIYLNQEEYDLIEKQNNADNIPDMTFSFVYEIDHSRDLSDFTLKLTFSFDVFSFLKTDTDQEINYQNSKINNLSAQIYLESAYESYLALIQQIENLDKQITLYKNKSQIMTMEYKKMIAQYQQKLISKDDLDEFYNEYLLNELLIEEYEIQYLYIYSQLTQYF